MTARRPASRGRGRRLARWVAIAAAMAGLVVVTDPVRAALLAAGGGLILVLVHLPRLGASASAGQPRAAASVRPEVIVTQPRRPATGPGLGVEGHRAYARALHAVTTAYLAECEREVER